MQVTERLHSVHDEACTLFKEIEGHGAQLEQVVTLVEQHLEGLVIEKFIQEFAKKEALGKKQNCLDHSDSGQFIGECWGLVVP
jgi:hypothetical protein